MKKFNFMALIATAALTMTSCSNDELTNAETANNETAISFSTYLGRNVESRASETTSETIKSGFGVFASYSSSESASSTTPNFMNNEKVTSTDGNTWTYTTTKYWPSNGNVSFFAYAPYASKDNDNGVSVDETSKDAPAIKVQLAGDTESSISTSNMVDFVAACKMKQTASTNQGKVQFAMKHEMTRAVFKVDNMDKNTAVTITSIKLSGKKLYKTASYKFASEDGKNGTWTLPTDASTDVTIDMGSNLSVTANKNSDYLYLIPVTSLDDDDIKVSITYTLTTTDDNLADKKFENAGYTQTLHLPKNTLVQGTSYLYTFKVSPKAVTLSATVEGWGSDTSSEIK